MQNSQREKAFIDRRLEKACKYVSDLWLPVNPALLDRVRQNLNTNRYDGQLRTLLDDLKGDVSLFAFCMRELLTLLRSEDGMPAAMTPLELLERAGLEQLKEILGTNESDISTHSLHSANGYQIERFQEILVSAASAEVLCEDEEIEPDLGFSTAVFRQLGLTLIAWNYPGVYQQAVSSLRENETLDLAITKILGFSPLLLAIRLARNWGLPQNIIEAMGPVEDADLTIEENLVTDAISRSLAAICKVSETLARANNPDLYPTARADWNEARNAVEERLGAAGVLAIQNRFRELSHHYVDAAPGIFKAGLVLDPEHRVQIQRSDEIISRNRYIPECRPLLQTKLISLYETLADEDLSRESVQQWARDLIPTAGFSSGCVFTVEPTLQMLIPQMKIGHTEIHHGEAVSMNHASDMVSAAYRNGTPVIRDHFGQNDTVYTSIAGIIGYSQRIGVLYLEMSRLIFMQSPEKHVLHFKALSQALNDCLNLR